MFIIVYLIHYLYLKFSIIMLEMEIKQYNKAWTLGKRIVFIIK